jgi:hypothetical protein
MSLEMLLFLNKTRIPDKVNLQNAVDSLGLPFQFDSALDLVSDRGFSPSSLKGNLSGFEIHGQATQEILPHYPRLSKTVGSRDWTITFRWGSRMSECACVLAASAAMIKVCDAVAYYPADDIKYTLQRLLDEFQDVLKQV